MANPFDHIHIKRRTAGSSNEISFDVLDAARNNLDSKKQRSSSRTPTAPRASQGSYEGVGKTSTLSAVPEVERRKKARRAHMMRIGVLVTVIVIAIVAAGVYMGYRYQQDKTHAANQYEQLLQEFVEVDKTIVAIDKLMVDPLNSVEADQRKQIIEGLSDTEAKLDAIVEQSKELVGRTQSPNNSVIISGVEDAVSARKGMMNAALAAFKLSEIANKQMNAASEAWGKVLAGDSMAREASRLANAATTEESVYEARVKTEEAIASLIEGRKGLVQVEAEVVGLDYSDEIAYIDKRLESLESALNTADALIEGDRQRAQNANTEYNEVDKEATVLASKLTYSVIDKVKDSYADEIKNIENTYGHERSHAATADAVLRAH